LLNISNPPECCFANLNQVEALLSEYRAVEMGNKGKAFYRSDPREIVLGAVLLPTFLMYTRQYYITIYANAVHKRK